MRFSRLYSKPARGVSARLMFAAWGLVSSLVYTATAMAQGICVPDAITVPSAGPPPQEPGGAMPIELEGDEVESVKKDVVSMRGNASLKRGRQNLVADQITYYRQNDEVEAKGNVVVHSENGDRLETSYIRLQPETFIGEAEAASYRLAKRGVIPADPDKVFVDARGTADKVFLEGHDFMRLENVRYTTCVEGQDDVFLSATEMTLDKATGTGTAKNVKVRFKDIPIFYFPRVSFPISDERKSGFLFPSIGTQEGSGFVLGTPYYWNMAPNYDATITPRLLAKRGVQVGAEFRYLASKFDGYLYGEYLPSDNEFGDEDRSAYTIKHRHGLSRRWRARVDYQYVSDAQYFDDFSNDIQISSSVFLPQLAEAFYGGRWLDFEARVFRYQTVDDTIPSFSEPYDRLPQFRAISRFPRGPYGLRYGFETELVNFEQDERVDGWRWDITPEVRLPLENTWGFLTPKLSLRHTSYDLTNTAEDQDSSPSRTVPVFSVDSGVFFDRETSWGGAPFLHTLEPRLFYVYIPEENQDDLPIFDTGFINLNNFGNIFRENRFFGRDRVGDTSQVTGALTSRFIDSETGREWVRGSIGQIFFLKDRVDNVLPDQVLTEDTSDFLAELFARLTDRWSTYGYLQYDDDDDKVREGKGDLRYRRGPRQYFDVGYRFSRDSLEQLTVKAEWPIGSPRWHVNLTERYSIRDDENLETRVGLEYDACCWKIRGFFQSRRDNTTGTRNALIFELELTGLARIRSGL